MQGLELDWSVVTWDADLRFHRDRWSSPFLKIVAGRDRGILASNDIHGGTPTSLDPIGIERCQSDEDG